MQALRRYGISFTSRPDSLRKSGFSILLILVVPLMRLSLNHGTHPSLTRRFFLRATGNASDHCILGLSPSGGPMRWDGNITTMLRFTSRIIAYATHARIIQTLNFFTRWGLLFPPNRSVTPKYWGRSEKWLGSIIFKMRTDGLASFADS